MFAFNSQVAEISQASMSDTNKNIIDCSSQDVSLAIVDSCHVSFCEQAPRIIQQVQFHQLQNAKNLWPGLLLQDM